MHNTGGLSTESDELPISPMRTRSGVIISVPDETSVSESEDEGVSGDSHNAYTHEMSSTVTSSSQ